MTLAGRRRLLCCALGASLLLLPPLADLAGEPFMVSLFSRVLIYAIAAVSLDLLLGFGAMVSLGHAAFFGVGAYVVAILAFHAAEGLPGDAWLFSFAGTNNALISWPLAVVVSALVATAIGALSLRTSGIYFIMITLAFAQMLFYFFDSLQAYGGDDGLSIWGRNDFAGLDLANDTTFYYVCLACLTLFLILCQRIVNSRFGMVIRGCAQNERRMRALGFPTYRYKLLCFAIAGAGAGLAGALIANQTEYVSPALLHWTRSGELLVMVILGGMGTLIGPVLGAMALLLSEDLLAIMTEHWQLYLGLFLVLVVLTTRRGIYGLLVGRGDGSD
ncbi:MAG: branched-chain amino acid ABC transporter permease [Gammaproteobacteria bacterium]|nr:branched-chain amino acid ABC transporter permease [Gammaproteobacteria bacterium]MDX2461037.1 branched-chain amino acid ABC transporter permease [Gammaproteobacteria bacterium]